MARRAPYQMTRDQAVRERRRAALLRAIAGVAERGPELGTDLFGSLQAGLRGSLGMGMEQEQMAQEAAYNEERLRSERMRAQADLERAERERVDPTQARISQIEAKLGRPLNELEVSRLFNFNEPERQPVREYGQPPFYENPEFDPVLREKYRADALYRAPASVERPSEQERQDQVLARQYGITPADVTQLREGGGFQPFRPMTITHRPGFAQPDTTFFSPAEPQATVQALNAVRMTSDAARLYRVMDSAPDEIVRRAAASRIQALRLPRPQPPSAGIPRGPFSMQDDR